MPQGNPATLGRPRWKQHIDWILKIFDVKEKIMAKAEQPCLYPLVSLPL